MLKKPSYGLQKFTAGCLALVAVLFFVSVGCSVTQMRSGEKHTGPVVVRCSNREGFEFKRPNGEIFEMSFSPNYLGPKIKQGDELSDLTYTDEKDHLAFFVKATLAKESETPQPSTLLYNGGGSTWITSSCIGTMCTSDNYGNSSWTQVYRWKDGAYHEKPEPTKGKTR